MNRENSKKLRETYPLLYRDLCHGFAVGDGWFQLIWDLSEKLSVWPEVRAVQVKEKFGVLRFYIDGGPEQTHREIEKAERFSVSVCDVCSAPGKMRLINHAAWGTRCMNHNRQVGPAVTGVAEFHLVSDLHLEFHEDGGQGLVTKLPDAETIVVAGDLTTSGKLFGALKLLSKKYPHVVYVPGNHDWYGGTAKMIAATKKRVLTELPRVHWLDRESVTINGQRFVGCTLWYPYELEAQISRRCMNDFEEIKDIDDWILSAHDEDKRFLWNNIEAGDIVVTHHLPSPRSIAKRYHGNGLNCYFLGDCEDLIEDLKPAVWCHGHTHDRFDYMHGETRVVCSPIGYPFETPWKPDHVCELGGAL